ncbi:MAG: hypothetical protein WBC92_15545 [Terracidiphilus sp.]
MPFRPFLLIAVACLSSVLFAQSEKSPHYQLYGGYTFLSNSINGVPGAHQPLNGIDVSFAFPPWHSLRFKMEVPVYIGTNLNAPQHVYFILAGWQFGHRIGKEYVFVEGLAGTGGINRNWGANASTGETASFSTMLGGGLDTPIARHISFRVSGGYEWANFALAPPTLPNIPYRIPGLPNNFGRVSSGIVWQF